MKNILTLFLLLLCINVVAQQNDIWVISNINLDKSDEKIDLILSKSAYSPDDLLVFHGNALHGSSNKRINKKIAEYRSRFHRVYVVPGDKDWSKLNSKKLKSIGDYLDDEYKGDVIVPENACGNVEVKEINDNLSLVFMDSNWFFSNWSDDKNLNKDCDITSRLEFWSELNGEIGGLKAKQIILFAQTPVFRNDEIGGHYGIHDHIFPLTNFVPWLYVPLPIVGTLISDSKTYLTPKENIISPLYQEYISQMKTILDNHPQLTLVTSDIRRNSIYEFGGNYQVNVNTSSKTATSHDHEGLIYGDDQSCILKMDINELEVTSNFISTKNGDSRYRAIVLDAKPFTYDESKFRDFNYSKLDRPATRQIRLSADLVDYNSFIFGKLNKSLYKNQVSVPQLNLEEQYGGLTPLRMGGGKQTNSLRLQDNEGNVYVARSLKKNPKKALPPGLAIKPLYKTMENFFMAADPLAFLTTPVLDSAANVYHITPRLLHLPKQPRLSIYNDIMGDELVLFRERADEAWPDKKSFGYSKNIVSSSSMIEKMDENKATPDAKMFLRARLLDLIVGDWDRHMDQWRWAEDADEQTYHPIARDRDQVYANFDGFIINTLRPYSINLLQLRSFDDELTRDEIRWMHWKSSILDNYVLNSLNEDEWQAETDYLKTALSASVLNEAVGRLPLSYTKQKENIVTNLDARIEDLQQISEDFRAELLTRVIVRGSNERDSIVIIQSKDEIVLHVFTDYRDPKKVQKRSYSYNQEDTDHVWLYGLKGDDVFQIIGKDNHKVKITIIGGYNGDAYLSTSNYRNITIIDDQPSKEIQKSTKIKYRYVTSKLVHDLNRADLTPTQGFFIPTLAYNTDDGVTLGGSYTWLTSGFKSNSTHVVGANYMTGRQSSLLSYDYNHTDRLTNRSKYLKAYWSGVRRQQNFYGGNGSSNTGDNDFYRVGISDLRVEGGMSKSYNSITSISTGVYGWSAKVEQSPDLFLSTTDIIDPQIFDREYFAGAKVGLELSNSDVPLRPTRLARLKLDIDAKTAVVAKRTNIKLAFEYDYYRPLIGTDRLLVSTKLQVGHLIGDYYLYEGFQLGGNHFLRGYRNGRFTGRSILAQNTNLQLKLVDRMFSQKFDCSAGVSAAFDHGRTWSDYDINDDWQLSYGGGVWISPLDLAVFSTGVYFSEEDTQVRINFNWQF